MGNPRRDPLPDFDTSYIDQLLSASNPSAKKEAPRQQAAPTTPKPAKPVTPAKPVKPAEPTEPEDPFVPGESKHPVIYLLLLIAVVCLLAGFFLGRWTVKANPDSDETLGTYIYNSGGTNPGIAEDYTAMSTEQLVNIAVRISELSSYGSPVSSTTLPPEVYRNLRLEHPVLAELEQRPDAITELQTFTSRVSLAQHRFAAKALISYYNKYPSDGPDIDPGISVTPACQWLVSEDDLVAIYEYTGSPEVQFIYGTNGSDGWIELNFGGAVYRLEGHESWSQGEPNFWFRVELKDNVQDILSRNPQPRLGVKNLSAGTNNGPWTKIRRYEGGWFVYGYTSKAEEVSFSFSPDKADDGLHIVTLTAFPDWESITTRVLAETVLQCKELIYALGSNNPEQDTAGYPLIRELLSREDGITYLLQAAAGERSSKLFSVPALRNQMTDAELAALEVLTGQTNYMNVLIHRTPLLTETPNGIQPSNPTDYHVGSTPLSLRNIPLSEMNCWIYVSLSSGALTLYQSNWDLEANLPPGHTVGVWKLYNNYNQLTGWIVSGKLTESDMIWLRLVKDNTLLQKTDVDYRVPES